MAPLVGPEMDLAVCEALPPVVPPARHMMIVSNICSRDNRSLLCVAVPVTGLQPYRRQLGRGQRRGALVEVPVDRGIPDR